MDNKRDEILKEIHSSIDDSFNDTIKEPTGENLEKLRKYVHDTINALTGNENPNDPDVIRHKTIMEQ